MGWRRGMIGIFLTLSLITLSMPHEAVAEPIPTEAAKKIKAKKLNKILIGTWKIHLPDELTRVLQIIDLATNTESSADAFEALEPTEEERIRYTHLRAKVVSDPDDPEVEESRALLEASRNLAMVITKRNMSATFMGHTEVKGYEVTDQRNNELDLVLSSESVEKSASLLFVDENTIVLREEDGQSFMMTR